VCVPVPVSVISTAVPALKLATLEASLKVPPLNPKA